MKKETKVASIVVGSILVVGSVGGIISSNNNATVNNSATNTAEATTKLAIYTTYTPAPSNIEDLITVTPTITPAITDAATGHPTVTNTAKPTNKPTVTPKPTAKKKDLVYWGESGDKVHTTQCRTITNLVQGTLAEAHSAGHTEWCKICSRGMTDEQYYSTHEKG
ncbi:MAG: hypothetical protein KH354_02495 [Clostridiales bacterium]|nr:hypothetical protein [Clostridiales bacterium]